ncbi:prepilin-type N-terminal cleavage/methylation domain-containing protein [Hydrogenophaga aquatica]
MLMNHATLSRTRQRGVSLVELMVGMAVGLVIVAAAGTMHVVTTRSGGETLASAQLNTALRNVMGVMVDEVRRAGYSRDGGRNSPFMNRTAGAVSDLAVNATGTCIEFSYDTDGNGTLADTEYVGFRVVNGVVQTRNGGAGAIADCANGTWESLTDSGSVLVSPHSNGQNYFVLSYQCMNASTGASDNNACVAGGTVFDAAAAGGTTVDLIETRTVRISLRGTLTNDNAMRMELEQRVQVRNHRVVTVG